MDLQEKLKEIEKELETAYVKLEERKLDIKELTSLAKQYRKLIEKAKQLEVK